MNDNRMEAIIIGYTLGVAFVGVTVIFVGKMVVLLAQYVSSGKVLHDLGGLGWRFFFGG